MKRNQETIDNLNQKVQEAISEQPTVRDCEKFNLKDLEIDDSVAIRDKVFSEKAIEKVLDILNVKPSFTEYKKVMEAKDWKTVAAKIKDARGDIELFGELDSNNFIHNVHLINPKKKKSDNMTHSLAIIENIENELSKSQIDFSLNSFGFDKDTYTFDINLRNESLPIEVFTGDEWKIGEQFIFNSLNFNHAPYFERLVCANGMTKPQFGFKSNISRKNFTNDRLEKVITNALSAVNDTHYQLLEQHAKRLKDVNVSLAEFYEFKNWFERGDRKEEYSDLIDKYFNEKPFYKAYGMPIEDQSKTWLRTADSGINGYDFVNLLTWIASHPEKTKLDNEACKELKIGAANLFFRKNFDMEELAPKVKLDYPRFVEMN